MARPWWRSDGAGTDPLLTGGGEGTEFERRRLAGSFPEGPLDDRGERRQVAGRVGGGGVAGQGEGLAAAAAEIELAPLAAAAGLGHPVGAAEAAEHRRVEPDLFEPGLPDVGELQAGDL